MKSEKTVFKIFIFSSNCYFLIILDNFACFRTTHTKENMHISIMQPNSDYLSVFLISYLTTKQSYIIPIFFIGFFNSNQLRLKQNSAVMISFYDFLYIWNYVYNSNKIKIYKMFSTSFLGFIIGWVGNKIHFVILYKYFNIFFLDSYGAEMGTYNTNVGNKKKVQFGSFSKRFWKIRKIESVCCWK